MTPVDYLDTLRRVLDHLQRTQLPAIEQAADTVIQALTHGGAVFCSSIGHGLEGDFIDRAGGLAALQPFSFTFSTNDPVAECLRNRPPAEPVQRDLESVRLAIRTGSLRGGDVMLVGSVSGRNRHPIELALACRQAGVKVIAFTSLAYTARVPSLHPSGQKLADVADVVIDNGAPFGDAAVTIPGYDDPMLPVSGAAVIAAGWMLWGRVMEKMAAEGRPASTYISINREGGDAHYKRSREEYHRRGY